MHNTVQRRTNRHNALTGVPYGVSGRHGEYIVVNNKTGKQMAVKGTRKEARREVKRLIALPTTPTGSNSLRQDTTGAMRSRSTKTRGQQ